MTAWHYLLAAALWLAAVAPAQAHRTHIFASANDGQITGYAYASDGTRLQQARITVTSAGGDRLCQVRTDHNGEFTFPAAGPIDHQLTVDSADGHRAQWLVSAAELDTTASVQVAAAAAGSEPPNSAAIAVSNNHELQQLIAVTVRQQLLPLRTELQSLHNAIRWQDVLGGIGYIIGMTGLWLYTLSRRQPAPSAPTRKL